MKPTQAESPAVLPSDGLVPLESVLCTEELNRRPSRPPDYEKENRALVALAQALADSPSTIFKKMTEIMLEMFGADSSGFSLLTTDDGGKRLYWPAISGVWKPYIGSGTPRDFGPCGDVLDRNAPQLFRHFERRYTYFLPMMPPVEECLVVPFSVEEKAVGTIWVIAHDNRREFDAEDLRQLVSLGRVASSAYQTVAFYEKTLAMNEALMVSSLRQHELTEAADSSNVRLQSEITERNLAEAEQIKLDQRLRDQQFYTRSLIEANIDALMTTDPSGIITDVNKQMEALTGYTRDELIGSPFKNYFTEPERAEAAIKLALSKTKATDYELTACALDGKQTVVSCNATTFYNRDRTLQGVFAAARNITERKQAEQRLHFLMNELAHRGKNLLAVVQSIASRSLSGTRPLTEARDVLTRRIQALARCQSALMTESFEGAPTAEIIGLEFEAFSDQVEAVGPRVILNPRVAQTFTLLVHELATNATKYGALSRPEGKVRIDWSIEGSGAEARFKLQWRERDGPPVVPPVHQGFGRTVLEKAAAQDFGALPKIAFSPEGVSYEIDALLSVMTVGRAGGGPSS